MPISDKLVERVVPAGVCLIDGSHREQRGNHGGVPLSSGSVQERVATLVRLVHIHLEVREDSAHRVGADQRRVHDVTHTRPSLTARPAP